MKPNRIKQNFGRCQRKLVAGGRGIRGAKIFGLRWQSAATTSLSFGGRVTKAVWRWASRRSPKGSRALLFVEQITLGLLICGSCHGQSRAATTRPDATNAPAASVEQPPVTAREFFNAGTQKFAAGKFTDAGILFQTALARQDDAVLPLALYNLGHVRFAEGSEELKKSPPAQQTKARSDHAIDSAGNAIRSAEAALAANEVQQMVEAYVRGRGARKELRGAFKAVSQALEVYGRTLSKWRRALGDFQSAVELNPADTNAVHNVSVVEQNIAALVDRLREMQMMGMQAGQKGAKLEGLMSQLKGRIPKDQMPPGAPGEDGEPDLEGLPLEELIGAKEGAGKEGQELEVPLSPEEAGNLLNGFRLGGDRRLPMGPGDPGDNKNRKLRNW